jgi:hypothetical protein
MLNQAAKLLLLLGRRRGPGETGGRTCVEVEDPDCQRDSEDRRSRRDGQAERRAEDAGEQSDTKQTRAP